MNYFVKSILTIILIVGCLHVDAQEYDGFKGKGVYQPYDKTYTNPSLRGKHGGSAGVSFANVSPITPFSPQWGFNVGYNYLLLYKRKRLVGIKERTRDEIKMGFGAHFYYFFNKEWYLNFNYFNPFIAIRGKVLGVYFFSEYGIGFHHAPQKMEDPPKTKFNVTIEALRFRFGKSPLNLSFRAHYDAGSALLSKNRMDLAFSASLTYYFYKRYKNKSKK